jgi:hypothetical protein
LDTWIENDECFYSDSDTMKSESVRLSYTNNILYFDLDKPFEDEYFENAHDRVFITSEEMLKFCDIADIIEKVYYA